MNTIFQTITISGGKYSFIVSSYLTFWICGENMTQKWLPLDTITIGHKWYLEATDKFQICQYIITQLDLLTMSSTRAGIKRNWNINLLLLGICLMFNWMLTISNLSNCKFIKWNIWVEDHFFCLRVSSLSLGIPKCLAWAYFR